MFLLVAWMPVATVNALPCAVFCMSQANKAHDHHAMGADHPMAGHHMPGARMSAPQHCGAPELLVVTCVPAELPAFQTIDVAVVDAQVDVVTPLLSATPEFGTPPPRA